MVGLKGFHCNSFWTCQQRDDTDSSSSSKSPEIRGKYLSWEFHWLWNLQKTFLIFYTILLCILLSCFPVAVSEWLSANFSTMPSWPARVIQKLLGVVLGIPLDFLVSLFVSTLYTLLHAISGLSGVTCNIFFLSLFSSQNRTKSGLNLHLKGSLFIVIPHATLTHLPFPSLLLASVSFSCSVASTNMWSLPTYPCLFLP